jgi:hypothetical protein
MRTASLPDAVSDTFTIAKGPQLFTGFQCTDSFLLYWNRQPVNTYRLYTLGNQYLEPLRDVADTFVILSRTAHPSLYYSVAPLVGGKAGLKGLTLKYDAQGVGCYFRSFYIQLQQGTSVEFQATLGSLYRVARVALMKRNDVNFTTVQTIQQPATLQLSFSDNSLKRGINYYRLRLTLDDGTVIDSEIIPVYYFPDAPVIVYPNPATQNQQLKLLSQVAGRYTVGVYDATGRLLQTVRLMEAENRLPFKALAKGLYFLRITDETGTVSVQKVVIY